MSNLFDGQIHWWGLDAGIGVVLDSRCAVCQDGAWEFTPGVGLGRGPKVSPPICRVDEFGMSQGGWTRSGVSGGFVSYPGGTPFWPTSFFSLAIFWDTSIHDPECPGYLTDFVLNPWGVGNYTTGDTVSHSGHPFVCIASYISDGSNPPETDLAHWRHMDDWYACYGDKSPWYSIGLVGDHQGFPQNAGWGILTEFLPAPIDGSNPDGVQGGFSVDLVCESPTTSPIRIAASAPLTWPPVWMMTVITNDGTTLRTYSGEVGGTIGLVGVADGTQFVGGGGGLGFGFYDNNKALSGKHELWQGFIDEAIMWNRPLDYSEIVQLPGNWCRRRYSLHSAHRATPNSNARASRSDAALHLSGMKHRADPQTTPSSGSGPSLVDLSGTSFRSKN